MLSLQVGPMLLAVLAGLVLSLLFCGVWRSRGRMSSRALLGIQDEILIALLALASFAFGAFITYALLGGFAM